MPDHFGYTVMHRAVFKRNTDVLRDLLSLGVSPMISGSSSVPCAFIYVILKCPISLGLLNDANNNY